MDSNKQMEKLGRVIRMIIDGEATFFEDKEISVILADFAYKKERYIQKEVNSRHPSIYKLYFDIDDGKKIIWDMLFLQRIIKKQIASNSSNISDLNNKSQKVVLTGGTYDADSIVENSLEDRLVCNFKESVAIIDMLRNSFSHDKNNSKCVYDSVKKEFIINNNYDGSSINCDIPVSYIERFGYGIVPSVEHKEIADEIWQEIDQLFGSVFFKSGYSLTEIPNFFYSVDPKRLDYLFSLSGGDVDLLEKLSYEVFFCSEERLELLLDKAGSIEDLVGLSYKFFLGSEKRLKFFLNKVKNIEELKYLAPFVFDISEERINELIAKTESKSIKCLKYLPETAFECSKEKLEFLLNKAGSVENLVGLSGGAFECSKEKIEFLLNKAGSIEELKWLPYGVFICPEENLKLLLAKAGNVKKIVDLPEVAFKCSKKNLELLLNKVESIEELECFFGGFVFYFLDVNLELLLGKAESIKDFDNLPEVAFKCSKKNLELLLNKVKSIEELKNLSDLAFDCSEEKIDKLIAKTECKSIEGLKFLGDAVFCCSEEKIDKLIAKTECKSIEGLKFLGDAVFCCSEEKIDKLIAKTECKSIEGLKFLCDAFFYCSEEKIDKLIAKTECKSIEGLKDLNIYFFNSSKESLKLLLGKSESIKDFDNLPEVAFKCSKKNLELLLNKVESIEELKNLPHSVFTCSEERLELLLNKVDLEGLNLNELSGDFFICSEKRLELLLNKVGLEGLKTLPEVAFSCNEELIDEVIAFHKNNVTKYCSFSDKVTASLLNPSNEKENAMRVYGYNSYRVHDDKKFDGTIGLRDFSDLDLRAIKIIKYHTEMENISRNMVKNLNNFYNKLTTPPRIGSNYKDTYKNLEKWFIEVKTINSKTVKDMLFKGLSDYNKEIVTHLRNVAEHPSHMSTNGNKLYLEDKVRKKRVKIDGTDLGSTYEPTFIAEINLDDYVNITEQLYPDMKSTNLETSNVHLLNKGEKYKEIQQILMLTDSSFAAKNISQMVERMEYIKQRAIIINCSRYLIYKNLEMDGCILIGTYFDEDKNQIGIKYKDKNGNIHNELFDLCNITKNQRKRIDRTLTK